MKEKWTDGDAYEMYVGRWSRKVGAGFLNWLAAPIGVHWLDLGCGTGALTSQILELNNPASVVGVEPSAEFLALATQQLRDPRVQFRRGTAGALPLEENSAQLAVSGLVLNFISDVGGAMRELIRVTQPGGIIASYVWDYAGHVQFMRYFWDAAVALNPADREKDEGVRFPICRPVALRRLFEAAGLKDISVGAVDITTEFENFEDYWLPFLSGIGPAPGYCMALDKPTRTKLKERIRESLPTDPDGIILLAARAWAVKGTIP